MTEPRSIHTRVNAKSAHELAEWLQRESRVGGPTNVSAKSQYIEVWTSDHGVTSFATCFFRRTLEPGSELVTPEKMKQIVKERWGK